MSLVFEFFHNLVGLLGHLLVDILALLVISVDKFRLIKSLLEVFLDKKVNSLLAILHSSRGIDARSHLEDDVAHGYLSSCQSACLDDSLKSD